VEALQYWTAVCKSRRWAIIGIVTSSCNCFFVMLVSKKIEMVTVLQRQHKSTVNTHIENKLFREEAQKDTYE
jgi:hypothetical protein